MIRLKMNTRRIALLHAVKICTRKPTNKMLAFVALTWLNGALKRIGDFISRTISSTKNNISVMSA